MVPAAVVRIALLMLALVLLGPRPAQSIVDFAGVDEAARDAVASGEIPGVVVLIGRGEDVLYHRAYGSRRLVPDPVPMTLDTIFDIASLTKPVGTAVAVMALVERGKISLDAPLGRYLKEYRQTVFNQVTIRRLLTHTAGLPGIPPDASVAAGFPAAARTLAKVPFDYPPGGGFQYSDMGFILLGEVVRRVSGQPLDRYLERTLFRPLGLRDTSFHARELTRSRIAPTEFFKGRMLVGEVHDPRARLLGGVAGHAGMFSTAADLSRICAMLVNGGRSRGTRILAADTVRAMWERGPDGNGVRTLGWDVASAFSRSMAPFFPPGSVGHTGFTGTALWLDPPTGVYMIVLTNRVHPNGGGSAKIRELRSRVAAAVGATLFQPPVVPSVGPAEDSERTGSEGSSAPTEPAAREPVRSGLDVLAEQGFAPIAGYSIGLITNQTGVDAQGRRNIDLLAAARGVRLSAIFSPEHGIAGVAESENIPHGRDAATGRPIWSLYGASRRPTTAMLRDINLIVFDIQDVGVRYYTYLTTLLYALEEAGRRGIPVVVLDRPNPITGRVVEGPLMDPDLQSFTGPHPLPVRTGLTIGEFARLVVAERKLPVSLTVIPMTGWTRGHWYDETGLPWVNPSPNIRSLTQALLYSGVGLLEATNLSVGRGTDMPFEVVGAPWINGDSLAEALNRLQLPGVRFEAVRFTPTTDRYPNTVCGGVRLIVTDRDHIRPVTVGLALAEALRGLHRDQFRPEGIQNLLVNRATMWAFLRGDGLMRVVAWSDMDRSSFLNRRASYLIYR